jgi:hypothetical protein
MRQNLVPFRLLLVGMWPRLAVASLLIAALWLGFFWATNTSSFL